MRMDRAPVQRQPARQTRQQEPPVLGYRSQQA